MAPSYRSYSGKRASSDVTSGLLLQNKPKYWTNGNLCGHDCEMCPKLYRGCWNISLDNWKLWSSGGTRGPPYEHHESRNPSCNGWDISVWTKAVEQPANNAILSHTASMVKNRANYKEKITISVGIATNTHDWFVVTHGNQDLSYNQSYSFAPVELDPVASTGRLDYSHWPAVEDCNGELCGWSFLFWINTGLEMWLLKWLGGFDSSTYHFCCCCWSGQHYYAHHWRSWFDLFLTCSSYKTSCFLLT